MRALDSGNQLHNIVLDAYNNIMTDQTIAAVVAVTVTYFIRIPPFTESLSDMENTTETPTQTPMTSHEGGGGGEENGKGGGGGVPVGAVVGALIGVILFSLLLVGIILGVGCWVARRGGEGGRGGGGEEKPYPMKDADRRLTSAENPNYTGGGCVYYIIVV